MTLTMGWRRMTATPPLCDEAPADTKDAKPKKWLRSRRSAKLLASNDLRALDGMYGETTRRVLLSYAGVMFHLTPSDEKTVEELR